MSASCDLGSAASWPPACQRIRLQSGELIALFVTARRISAATLAH
jgi:hypothetical protein